MHFFRLTETMGNVKDVLGRWKKKVGEASRKAEDFAGNTWQHCKAVPSVCVFVCHGCPSLLMDDKVRLMLWIDYLYLVRGDACLSCTLACKLMDVNSLLKTWNKINWY